LRPRRGTTPKVRPPGLVARAFCPCVQGQDGPAITWQEPNAPPTPATGNNEKEPLRDRNPRPL